MPYIGNTSPSRFVSNRAASVYSGDGSTTAFTLEQAVAQDEDVLVSVDGVIIKATDGKQYRIMTSYGNQHFEDGEVYLDGITDAGFIDPEGYPDAAELLYYHTKDGTYVQKGSGMIVKKLY